MLKHEQSNTRTYKTRGGNIAKRTTSYYVGCETANTTITYTRPGESTPFRVVFFQL